MKRSPASPGDPRPAVVETHAARTWSAQEDAALRVWIALARSYATFSRAVAVKVADYGLTTPQFGVLEALHHLGPLTLGELAEKLLVTGGNITYVMDRLEDQGLVARERCDDDRRVVWAKLTTAGRDRIASVFGDHAAFVHELVGTLDPQEQAELRALLKKLGKGVTEEGDEPG